MFLAYSLGQGETIQLLSLSFEARLRLLPRSLGYLEAEVVRHEGMISGCSEFGHNVGMAVGSEGVAKRRLRGKYSRGLCLLLQILR